MENNNENFDCLRAKNSKNISKTLQNSTIFVNIQNLSAVILEKISQFKEYFFALKLNQLFY